MLHHRRQGDRERRRDFRNSQLAFARQAVENGAPRRIGERRKGKVELLGFIVNHVVKYWVASGKCQALGRGRNGAGAGPPDGVRVRPIAAFSQGERRWLRERLRW